MPPSGNTSIRNGELVTIVDAAFVSFCPAVSVTCAVTVTCTSSGPCGRFGSDFGISNEKTALPAPSVFAPTEWNGFMPSSRTVTSSSTAPPATGWPKK